MTKKKCVVLDTNILMGVRKIEPFRTYLNDNYETALVDIQTLLELDRLKTKEGQKGYEARSAMRLILNCPEIKIAGAELNLEQYKEIAYADALITNTAQEQEATLLTNDVAMAAIAGGMGIETKGYKEPKDSFRPGYFIYDLYQPEIQEELIDPYLALNLINEDILVGEYIVFTEYNNYISKVFIKEPNGFEEVNIKGLKIDSEKFGILKPKGNDIAQILAFHMLGKNDISLLTGPAGSGKTLLALGKQLEMLQNGEIQKITVFVNPEKARGAKTLGFYKGDRNLKLMQESIGGILASKLGSVEDAIDLIDSGVLEIIPVSDIRGYEVQPFSSLYITEAQNLTTDLMQLALQRASEGVKIFIEGDPTTQLDSWMYEGDNNGILKLIDTFGGSGLLGNIRLDCIYRSPVASLADDMTKRD